MARLRLVVLVSGRGSNLESLIAASKRPGSPIEVALVVSNRAQAPALDVALREGVPVRIVPSDGVARDAHDRLVGDAVDSGRPDLVLLAGYMRILGADLIARFRGRLLNIHPSLLPAFPGLDAPAQAHARRVAIAGCTVHFVTEDVDAGPILAQAALAVDPAWSVDELRARILALEHTLYPAAVTLLATGRAKLDGARVLFSSGPLDVAPIFSTEALP